MQPQGLARAQLQAEDCAFFCHPSYLADYVAVTAYSPSYATKAGFTGYMWTPDGYCLVGASVYCNPSTACGMYVGFAIDDAPPYWASYAYANAAGWVQQQRFIVPIYGLDRNKRHKFALTLAVSGVSTNMYVYQGSSGINGSFWGLAWGLDMHYQYGIETREIGA